MNDIGSTQRLSRLDGTVRRRRRSSHEQVFDLTSPVKHGEDDSAHSSPFRRPSNLEVIQSPSESSPIDSEDRTHESPTTHRPAFSLYDLPDPSTFKEPGLSFMTTSTAESASGGSGRNSDYLRDFGDDNATGLTHQANQIRIRQPSEGTPVESESDILEGYQDLTLGRGSGFTRRGMALDGNHIRARATKERGQVSGYVPFTYPPLHMAPAPAAPSSSVSAPPTASPLHWSATGQLDQSRAHMQRSLAPGVGMGMASLTCIGLADSRGEHDNSPSTVQSPLSGSSTHMSFGLPAAVLRTRSDTVSSHATSSSYVSNTSPSETDSPRPTLPRSLSQDVYEGSPRQPSWLDRDPAYSENSHERASTSSYPNSQSVSRTNSSSFRHSHSRREHRYHQYHGAESSFASDLEANAVALVEDGRSLTVDMERIARWGGMESLKRRLKSEINGEVDGGVIEEFAGATHVLLPSLPLSDDVYGLLSSLLPIITSTLVVLDVSNCSLDALPDMLAHCHVLEELNVSKNPLSVLPCWLGQLTNLRVLVVDDCSLKQLPSELADVRNLHTICARRNFLISLPSWLSQMSKLQTLMVDDNPFAGQWKDLVRNIVFKVEKSVPPVPQIPERFASRQPSTSVPSSDHRQPSVTNFATPVYDSSAAPSTTSLHSQVENSKDDLYCETSASVANNRDIASSPYGGLARSTSASFSLISQSQGSVVASPQAEATFFDPNVSVLSSSHSFAASTASSPLGPNESIFTEVTETPTTVVGPRAPSHPATSRLGRADGGTSSVVRRMRSAGNLLSFRNPSQEHLGRQMATEPPSDADEDFRPPQPRFATFGTRSAGRSNTSLSTYRDPGLTDDESPKAESSKSAASGFSQRSVSDGKVPPQNKTSKWGFLKKMSMSRLRASTSASSNAARPPAPPHSKSVPAAESMPVRPPIGHPAYSTGTLPTVGTGTPTGRDLYGGTGRNQHPGRSNLRLQTTLTTVQASPPHPNVRGKRQSFLPIFDASPALNIAIPTISPFMSSAAVLSSEPRSQHLGVSLDQETLASPDEISNSIQVRGETAFDRLRPAPERTVPYDVGLRSIMSYLRDLYDLSLPVPAAIGGAEVVAPEVGTGSGSMSAGSDPRAESPSPMIGQMTRYNTIVPGLRSRRPTGSEMTREVSEHSMMQSNGPGATGTARKDSAEEEEDDGTEGRPESMPNQVYVDVEPTKKYKDDAGKRAGVVRHILETERTYVQGLRELVDIYVNPAAAIVSSKTGETMIPVGERKIVFGGIEGILRFHKDSFLPALETATKELIDSGDDATGDVSKRAATSVGQVFRTYNPFMRQYSAYINNFDFALQRLRKWTSHGHQSSPTSNVSSPGGIGVQMAAVGVGLGLAAVTPPATPDVQNPPSLPLSSSQRKRVRAFLHNCRSHPRHSQINLESYLLLPVQRIPRYRLLLEDLARSTPPTLDIPLDTLEDALQEMTALASSMNEEKRDSESRRRLVKWQSRIRGKFATPLVQAHRRLLLDGYLVLSRVVKRSNVFVEVPTDVLPVSMPPSAPASPFGSRGHSSSALAEAGDDTHDQDRTITAQKAIVQIEALSPEVSDRKVAVVLTNDLMILCKDVLPPTPTGLGLGDLSHIHSMPMTTNDGMVDLYAVLRLQTKRRPARVVRGNEIRLVDNKSILYFTAASNKEAVKWVKMINSEFDPMR